MGTRGLMAFAHDGKVKAMYNHFDSYPSGLGQDIVDWILKLDEQGFAEAIEQSDRLEAVDEEVPPTEDQQLALLKYFDPGVATRSSNDWYSLLRHAQGNPTEALKAGFFVDYNHFACDSLFCEWGYVVDLDRRVLEVYVGFQHGPHNLGRWASSEGSDGYYPIKLIREFTLEELREDPEAMNKLEENDD